jgi:hypothetical protein
MGRQTRAVLPALLVLILAGRAHAQDAAAGPSPADLARSEGLFKEASVLLDSGHVAEACPKFAESQRLAPGTGVTLYLADCYERIGRTASAWREFRRAEQMASAKKDNSRANIAKTRANALEPQLSMLTIEVPAKVRVPGIKVTNDGADVPESAWGKSAAADAGQHVITASAPGYRRREFNVLVPPNKGTASVMVEALEAGDDNAPVAKPETPTPAPVAAAPAAPPPETTVKADTRDGSSQRWIGLGIGAAGVVATGVGLVFGLSAQSKLDDSNQPGNCNAQDLCSPNGLQLRDDASSAATLSTIFVGVGIAAMAGGAILYFTAPHASPTQRAAASRSALGKPRVLPTPTGVLIRF